MLSLLSALMTSTKLVDVVWVEIISIQTLPTDAPHSHYHHASSVDRTAPDS